MCQLLWHILICKACRDGLSRLAQVWCPCVFVLQCSTEEISGERNVSVLNLQIATQSIPPSVRQLNRYYITGNNYRICSTAPPFTKAEEEEDEEEE